MTITWVLVSPSPSVRTGQSTVSVRMTDWLEDHGQDCAPVWFGSRVALLTGLIKSLVLLNRPETALYLSARAGRGWLLDAAVLVAARLRQRRIVIHHHSRGHISQPEFGRRLVYRLIDATSVTHVVLCEELACEFKTKFDVNSSTVAVLENSWLVPDMKDVADARCLALPASPPLEIGFLSNLMPTKGVDTFFRYLDVLRAEGADVRGHIAGPYVHPDTQSMVEHALAERADFTTYWGPLDDDAKRQFFSTIDWLVFPSRYPHESAPLVIDEAMSAGVPVLSTAIGCIPSMLTEPCLTVECEFGH